MSGRLKKGLRPLRARIRELERALEKAVAQAESASEAKNIFLATLSHELRTPLTSILAWSQLLKIGPRSRENDQLILGLDIIEKNALIQTQLINDLLDLSRIQTGTLSLNLSLIDPLEMTQSALTSLQPMASAKNITFEISRDLDLGKVTADPIRVAQILMNLISNAIKFSSEGGLVKIKLALLEDDGERKASISVIDQGKGIDPDFLAHLFTRFRHDGSSTRVHGGMGIGLALVSDLARSHGGRVTAESAGLGKGATFTVVLPRASLSTDRAEQRAELERPDLTGLNVLLVDDEPSILAVFAQLVDAFGGSPIVCDSVSVAMNELQKSRVDVLVSDLAMPVEDGYALMRKVRALPPERGGRVPAIALTAFTAEADVQKTASVGFHRHMAKPVDAGEFGRAIAGLAKRPATSQASQAS